MKFSNVTQHNTKSI